MKRWSLYFCAPEKVELRQGELGEPGQGEVLVKTILTGISPGTEMLIYRGQVAEELSLDETIPSLQGFFRYPFEYGYSNVGRVIALGEGVDPVWQDRLVFGFQVHCNFYISEIQYLLVVPDGITPEDAVFLSNTETALNLVMDGSPIVGEAVAVFGLGVVGLLTTRLLAEHPLLNIAAFDLYPGRRNQAAGLENVSVFDPMDKDALPNAQALFKDGGSDGADLVFELSGSPRGLNQAIQIAGYASRIVIGSWYGKSESIIHLDGRFHRSRIRMISSQVSHISPELSGRWSKSRRFALTWDIVRRIHPSSWITHRIPLSEAKNAYRMLAEDPGAVIQIVLDSDL